MSLFLTSPIPTLTGKILAWSGRLQSKGKAKQGHTAGTLDKGHQKGAHSWMNQQWGAMNRAVGGKQEVRGQTAREQRGKEGAKALLSEGCQCQQELDPGTGASLPLPTEPHHQQEYAHLLPEGIGQEPHQYPQSAGPEHTPGPRQGETHEC